MAFTRAVQCFTAPFSITSVFLALVSYSQLGNHHDAIKWNLRTLTMLMTSKGAILVSIQINYSFQAIWYSRMFSTGICISDFTCQWFCFCNAWEIFDKDVSEKSVHKISPAHKKFIIYVDLIIGLIYIYNTFLGPCNILRRCWFKFRMYFKLWSSVEAK